MYILLCVLLGLLANKDAPTHMDIDSVCCNGGLFLKPEL